MNLPTLDKLGRAFDPAKFLPRLDALGRWINARAGRKSKPGKTATRKPSPVPMSTTADTTAPAAETPATNPGETFGEAYTLPPANPAANTAPETAATASPEPAAPSFADIERAARTGAPAAKSSADPAGDLPAEIDTAGENLTVETIIGVIQTALVLIGDDEGILSPMEKRLLRAPLERVLKKYNVGSNALPPEADLAFAVASLVVVRIQKPKTATWFAKVKAWCVQKFFAHEGRKLAARAADATQ